MANDVARTVEIQPIDIARFFRRNLKKLGLEQSSENVFIGNFNEFMADKKRYFRVTMKDSVVYVDCGHPDTNPDTSWLETYLQAYLTEATKRGMKIKGIEIRLQYHPDPWAHLID